MSNILINDVKENIDEIIEILEEYSKLTDSRDNPIKDPDYMETLIDLMQRFKFWKPEIFVYVDGGNIQGASANCNMIFNLWDNDNEKARNEKEEREESYHERHQEWNWMIESGHKSGELKSIY